MNRSLPLLIFAFVAIRIVAQKTAIQNDPELAYKQGLELYDKKQFAPAQKNFLQYARNGRSRLLKADAAFYAAVCGIELFNPDGEWLMRNFIHNYPAALKANEAYFYLGKSNFRKKKHKETLEHFESVDPDQLSHDQADEFFFKRGYSYLQRGDETKAKSDFKTVHEGKSRYAAPALYYHAHLAYKEKNYDAALQGFTKLSGNETFGAVVPYYITQIYFIQGKYDQVTREGPRLLRDSSHIQKSDEINRMIGESYFNLKDYSSAITYLKKSNPGNPQGYYTIGYCYYKLNNCAAAIPAFERATESRDSLAQSAWYHLADCYVKTNEKLRAKNAFYSAYQQSYDKRITEDALFSFAKLSYELDFNPYNEAVRAFTKYLNEYPKSPRKDECYNFLISVYSTTRNYPQAIKSIESLDKIDPVLKITYQRLLFHDGVEHFNNSDLINAEKLFRKSISQNSDMALNAQNQYWLGEISYIRKDYSTAIDAFKKVQSMPGTTDLTEGKLTGYALGYAHFQRKEKDDYASANLAFRKFLSDGPTDEKKIADATIRAADCFFMNKDFAQASEYYRRVIDMGKFDADYCIYQKALCDGLNRNYAEKVTGLKKIESTYPHSHYFVASLNEIAETYYFNLKEEDNAILYYEKILSDYPKSLFANNSYAQLGNIYYGKKQDDKALEYFDKFVRNNPRTAAAGEVLESIRKIFESKGRVEEMEKYFVSVGQPLSENQIEKAAYMAAYDEFYNNKNCDEALVKWESYISRFPSGKYITEARFNHGECAFSKEIFDKALADYLYIVNQSRNMFTEVSLSKSSYLLFKDKKYEEALPLFIQLEELAETPANKTAGKLGAMRCAFFLSKWEVALDESNKVLSSEKVSPQQQAEARYDKARSLFELSRLDDAMTEFNAIFKSGKNASAAEAGYFVAKIHFSRNEFKEVEKTVTRLISSSFSNDDWNNKAMLLLSDAYVAKGDLADAEVILQTILEGKPKQEYADEAAKKLEELKAKKDNGVNAEKMQSEEQLNIRFSESRKDSLLYAPEKKK